LPTLRLAVNPTRIGAAMHGESICWEDEQALSASLTDGRRTSSPPRWVALTFSELRLWRQTCRIKPGATHFLFAAAT
jgi:hypothetical protein